MPGKGQGGGNGKPPKGDGPLDLNGNKKDNVLTGGPEDDSIWGRDGDDTLTGMGGGDFIHGGHQNDIVIGDSGMTLEDETTDDGDDRLFGGDGDDELYGGGGDDELQGGDGFDILDGGSGYDIALYSADDEAIFVTPTATGFTVDFVGDLPTEDALNIEGIVGTYYGDTLTGALDRPNTLIGYYGNDTITGGNEADWLEGHGDIDTIDGGGGNDMIAGGSGGDTLTGGTGNDTFIYRSAYEGADTLTDFASGQDEIDLTALDLTSGGTVNPVELGIVFTELVLGETHLFVDLTGGGSADGTGDDLLLLTSANVINVETDVLV